MTPSPHRLEAELDPPFARTTLEKGAFRRENGYRRPKHGLFPALLGPGLGTGLGPRLKPLLKPLLETGHLLALPRNPAVFPARLREF